MKIGVVFPQTEFGHDAAALIDYAQAAEDAGYHHILAYDHVLGANPQRPGGWNGPYTHESSFLEPFVMFSFMAAATTRIQFTTGILILPQRQTALVAKQAATLDVLSHGRLRVGVGLGWNEVEYEALGEDFHNRGRRIEEQVALLQKLWTEPLVTFEGTWHRVSDAGLKPMPMQRPIPIWFGGHADAVLRRAARLGAGWMPNYRTTESAGPALASLHRYLEEAGRSAQDFGIEPRLAYGDANRAAWQKWLEAWRDLGATHASLNTMACGFETPAQHIQAIRSFARDVAAGFQ